MRLFLVPALVLFASCAHSGTEKSRATASTATPRPEDQTAKEHFKDGWQNVKQGTREVASGVGAGAKKVGTAIHSVACPIAADVRAGIYYAKDSPGYERMLSGEKSDVRECFASEAGAREKGYTLVR
jgi:hypothetical protein